VEPSFLQVLWFILYGVLIAVYAILDGFDLGVGVISLFKIKSSDKRILKQAIGPVWDGNEVWLLTGGGALFAAFPIVYATVFSSFYMAFMLLLFALIGRAVSLEFSGKVESPVWEKSWDICFGISSLLPCILFGVAIGNIMKGIPLNQEGIFTGTFLGLLNPYSLIIGLLSLSMFITHGALYMALKTEGQLAHSMRVWAARSWMAWVSLYGLATVLSFFMTPHLFEKTPISPLKYFLILVLLTVLILIPLLIHKKKNGWAFTASSLAIVCHVLLVGSSLFPRFVISSTNLEYSLLIANSSSTNRTLTAMLVITLAGLPIVIAYTIWIYRIFKGRVINE
jgi:cytochrome d ubiquinol oxidase subunit II